MHDLRRARYVTQNYVNLQGLRWVIWGILCLAVAAEDSGWLPTPVLVLIAFPIGIILFLWAGYYYAQNFGRVEAPDNAQIELLRVGVLAAAAITSFLVDRTLHPPVSVALLVLAAGLLIIHWQTGPLYRWHYLALALLVVGADIGLLFVELPPGSPFARPGVLLWSVIGFILIISGLLDHRILFQTLKPVQ